MLNKNDLKHITDYVMYLNDSNKVKIYLSGPISLFNNDKKAKDFFNEEEKKLVDYIIEGNTFEDGIKLNVEDILFVNPFDFGRMYEDRKSMGWCDFMAYDFLILNQCDYIYMLPDWNKSKGAIMEHEFVCNSNKIKRLVKV